MSRTFGLWMQAQLANLEAYVGPVGEQLEIKICGFNDKLPALLSKILATVKSFLPTNDRLKVCHSTLCVTSSRVSLAKQHFNRLLKKI